MLRLNKKRMISPPDQRSGDPESRPVRPAVMEDKFWRLRRRTANFGEINESSFRTENAFRIALQAAYLSGDTDLVGTMPEGLVFTEAKLRQRYPPEARISSSVDLDVLTTKEAATLLGIAESEVRRLAEEGRLPAYLLGNHWRFHRAELLNFIRGDWNARLDGES